MFFPLLVQKKQQKKSTPATVCKCEGKRAEEWSKPQSVRR